MLDSFWWRIGAAGAVALVLTGLVMVLKNAGAAWVGEWQLRKRLLWELGLHDGEMVLNDKAAIPYTVGRDTDGAYILPRTYVGSFQEIGFEIDGSRPAIKLRLDRISNPTNLLVQGGSKTTCSRGDRPSRLEQS